jgi:hypothetical protein
MGRVCSSVRVRSFGGVLRKGDYLDDPGVDGRILEWVLEKWDGGMD